MKGTAVGAVFCLFLSPFSLAQDDAESQLETLYRESLPVHVAVLVECIALDIQTLSELLVDHGDGATEKALRAAVDARLNDGSAELVEMGYLITRSGQSTQLESVVELIFANGYHPSELPREVTGPLAKENDLLKPATPTAFETRNLGSTIRMTPSVGPTHELIDIDLQIDWVQHVGDDTHGQGVSQVTFPRLHTQRVTDTFTVGSGDDVLAGILEPPDAGEQRILAFVRAVVLHPLSLEHFQRIYFPNGIPAAPKALNDGGTLDDPTNGDPFAATKDDDGLVDPASGDLFASTTRPSGAAPRNIVTQIEYIDVDQDALHPLMRRLPSTSDATALRREVGELIQEGKARSVDMALVTTHSGRRAKVESVEERIYPVEIQNGEQIAKLQGPIEAGATIRTPANYTTFEMRPAGITLEVDAQLGPDLASIDVSIAPERVAHLGVASYGQKESQVDMPLFKTQRLSTNVTTYRDNYLLLGLHSDRRRDGSNAGVYTLAFLRCSLRGGE